MSQAIRSLPEPDRAQQKEARLRAIRKEAELRLEPRQPEAVVVPAASPEEGYYGLPQLKGPTWTWEVPLYFFVGGLAGTAGTLSAIGRFANARPSFSRDASYIALGGAMLSAPLLVSDLGRPARFLAMLRVFKPQSPMSVGVWTLLAFSSAAFANVLGEWMQSSRNIGAGSILRSAGNAGSMIFGPLFASYTGVLIGATVVPVWNRNVGLLPLHFVASGLGASIGILELRGHRQPELNKLALGAAAVETAVGTKLELSRDPASRPLKRGPSGLITRVGGVLSGPIPLALRVASLFARRRTAARLRRFAGFSALIGSAVTRVAWVHAGHTSAKESRP